MQPRVPLTRPPTDTRMHTKMAHKVIAEAHLTVGSPSPVRRLPPRLGSVKRAPSDGSTAVAPPHHFVSTSSISRRTSSGPCLDLGREFATTACVSDTSVFPLRVLTRVIKSPHTIADTEEVKFLQAYSETASQMNIAFSTSLFSTDVFPACSCALRHLGRHLSFVGSELLDLAVPRFCSYLLPQMACISLLLSFFLCPMPPELRMPAWMSILLRIRPPRALVLPPVLPPAQPLPMRPSPWNPPTPTSTCHSPILRNALHPGPLRQQPSLHISFLRHLAPGAIDYHRPWFFGDFSEEEDRDPNAPGLTPKASAVVLRSASEVRGRPDPITPVEAPPSNSAQSG